MVAGGTRRGLAGRITPMLKELAAKVQVAIEDLKNNPEHAQTFSYRDDYSAIAEISSKLAAQISDVVQNRFEPSLILRRLRANALR
jgi:hypothetical protein